VALAEINSAVIMRMNPSGLPKADTTTGDCANTSGIPNFGREPSFTGLGVCFVITKPLGTIPSQQPNLQINQCWLGAPRSDHQYSPNPFFMVWPKNGKFNIVVTGPRHANNHLERQLSA
jgi:hypothetical protein